MDLVLHVRHKLNALPVLQTDQILVGVSGGIDSMVLLHVLHHGGYTITAAHVNFKLRGTASDDDAAFVAKWCSENNIPFLLLEENTKVYASLHSLNTQMAARKIRYDWWEWLRQENGFDHIATAHHLDDQIETVLINLLRGTGIKGIRGIPARRDYFIRPLLDIPRLEIESYADTMEIPFRADQSNESDDYLRNRIRHHLVPLLEQLSPGFHARMKHTSERIDLEWNAWEHVYAEWENNHVHPAMDGYEIDLRPGHEAFLLRWLENRGIPWKLAYDYIASSTQDSGKTMIYGSEKLSRTAEGYFLKKINSASLLLHVESTGTYETAHFSFSITSVPHDTFIPKEIPGVACMSSDVVIFPLHIRGIEPGDAFEPLGMPGKRKKIQDLLVDRKLEMHEKERTLVLTNPYHILWVIDQQLDDRAKVKPVEKEIYRATFKWKTQPLG